MPILIGKFKITDTYCSDCPLYEFSDGGDYKGSHFCNIDLVGGPEVELGPDSWSSGEIKQRKSCPGIGEYFLYKESDHMHY